MLETDSIIGSSDYPLQLSSRVLGLGNYHINLFLVQGDKKTALFEAGLDAAHHFIERARQMAARPRGTL